MRFEPHDYQRRAIGWVEDHPRCLLFLDMGLGKSVITLTAIARLRLYCEAERVLVLAPGKVAESTWSDEASKWDHLDLRVVNVKGTPKQRERLLETDADIFVVSRDLTAWLVEHYGKKVPFDMLVLDELTSFKNPKAIRFKSLRRWLPFIPRVVGLTGTPTPNGLFDLWAQVYCVDQGARLGKFVTGYRKEFFNVIEHNNIIIKKWLKDGAKEEIMRRISDIALSMRAEDWLTLPPMIIRDVAVDLGEKRLESYRRFEDDSVMEFERKESEPGAITAANAAALLNKLSQYADGAIYDDTGAVVELHEEKLTALSEIIEQAGGPVLCFYQFKHDADRISTAFRKMKVRRYEGASELKDWNEGKIDLLLAHPASTAFGLNMQRGGSVIVWFSTGWNLELYQQANARLHRQGQTRPVRVFNLIASGTVDERMAEALRSKKETQDSVMKRLASRIVSEIRHKDIAE